MGPFSFPTLTQDRFRGLRVERVCGLEVPVAESAWSRLMGLACLDRDRAGAGLLIPGCRAVHTFWMRFPIDLVFLNQGLEPVAVFRDVTPNRFRRHLPAWAVLEIPSGKGERVFDL